MKINLNNKHEFRSKTSMTDNIHTMNQLKKKCREYNIPLCDAFVDYEKAFHSLYKPKQY